MQLQFSDADIQVLVQMVEYAAEQACAQVSETAPPEVLEQAQRYSEVADRLVTQVEYGGVA